MSRESKAFQSRKEHISMKHRVMAIASLFFLSVVFSGVAVSPVSAAAFNLDGKNTHTPGPKTTKKANAKTPKGHGNPKEKKNNFAGEVIQVGDSSLEIRTDSRDEVSFLVTESTSIKIPTLGKNATLGDISTGTRALVRAVEGDGFFTAVQISVVPGKPPVKHHVGVVTAYEPETSITILAHDGEEYTFLIAEDAKLLPQERADELAVGRTVTIISRRDPTGGPFTAQGIVIHPIVAETTGTPEETPTETPTPPATETPTETLTLEPSLTETCTPSETPS
jgi:hypothetical protein